MGIRLGQAAVCLRQEEGAEMREPKGWWRIAISNRVLQRLEGMRSKLQEHSGKHLLYGSIIEILTKKLPKRNGIIFPVSLFVVAP